MEHRGYVIKEDHCMGSVIVDAFEPVKRPGTGKVKLAWAEGCSAYYHHAEDRDAAYAAVKAKIDAKIDKKKAAA